MNKTKIILLFLLITVIYFIFRSKNQPKMEKHIKKDDDEKILEKLIREVDKKIERKEIDKREKKKDKLKIKNKDDLVFLEVGINNKSVGKIIIKLASDITPITCKNFRTLCETKKYVDSPFHRIISDFMLQGGDYTKGDGTGGRSIYGETFKDENFILKHNRPYLLSMANCGPNTNGSQFFITTNETPHLDGIHVVFGEVTKGIELIDKLNMVKTDGNDRPHQDIRIIDCGVI